MKRSITMGILFLFAAALLAACGGDAPEPEVVADPVVPTTAVPEETSSEDESSSTTTEATLNGDQNDANSGGDAGMGDDPLPISAGTGLPGLLNGSSDFFDVYQFEAEPYQIVRVVLTNAAESSGELSMDLSNGDGYDLFHTVAPGESMEIVMGSSNATQYKLDVQKEFDVETAVYSFDVIMESENDAGTAADAPNEPAQAITIMPDTPYSGASIGRDTGGNDEDCYQVNVPIDGGIEIRLTSPSDQPYESFVGAELYNEAGELITSNTAQYGQEISLAYGVESYEMAVAGNYVVCFDSYEFYSYGEYVFTAVLTE